MASNNLKQDQFINLKKLTNLPLSSNQKRLWVISKVHKSNPAYNLGYTYHLKGILNLSLFQESLNILFNRHLILFSVFKDTNGTPYSEIVPKHVNIDVIDFSEKNTKTGKSKIRIFVKKDTQKPFDLETGPLYRLYLLKLNENEYVFHVTIHHMIFDGMSWNILIHDFTKIYENIALKKDVTLEPLRFQSYDYARWEKEMISQEEENKLLSFWKEYLKDIPPELKFPYDHPRKNIPTGHGNKELFKIPAKYAKELKKLSKENGCSLYVTLLSAIGILFQKYSGQSDICIGIPVSCRTHPSLKNLIGILVNTIVVRLKADGNINVAQYLKHSKSVFLRAIINHKLPFEKVVEAVKPERIPNLNPLFQLSVVLLDNIVFLPLDLGEIKGEQIPPKEGVSPFDMIFYFCETEDYIEGMIEYNIDILERDTIIRLKNNYIQLLKSIIKNPDQTISDVSSIIESQPQITEKTIDLIHLSELKNLPLTKNQKRILFICKLQAGIPMYILTNTYQLQGPIDYEVFQKSMEMLFLRHHIVFSTFKQSDGESYCDIIPSKVNINFIDYSELPLNEKDEKIIELIDKDSTKIFDLESGPLYRLYLIKTNIKEYYFHLSIHQIIFDGWSWSIIINDFSEIYNSLTTGKEVHLEKIKFQQYDYAHWEETSSHLENNSELTKFWKETLKEVPPFLDFPYDFSKDTKYTGKGGREIITLPKEISQKLRKISEDENSSLFATMLSAYAILMHKYSREDDICIGIPVTHRPHNILENTIGIFVNTVVVRIKFNKDLTFKNVIHLATNAAMDAIAHQDLPFENIVDIVKPERSINLNPIFQVSFAWKNNQNISMKLTGIISKRITGKEVNSVYDINLSMWENEENVEGDLDYSKDLFKTESIIRLRDNFLTLINNLVKNSDSPIDAIPMISDKERKIIQDFKGIRTDYPKDKTIVQLFEEQVILHPDKIAVFFKDDSLTYRQLNEKTNKLARTLRVMGVKNNTPVALLVEKSADMITGILGILKAGGAYVPVDPEYPEQRINFMIKDSGCSILLTQKELMGVKVEAVTKLNLNSPASYSKDKSNVERISHPLDLAYIMYTSGTTGVPKGSLIQQYSVVRLVRNTNYINLTHDDRILLTGAIVFDATTFEIWGALLNGGSLFIVEKETILDSKALGEELLKNKISVLWLTSPLFTNIAETRTDIFAGLKYLLVGGDVLSANHINKVRKDNPQLKVINGYGPTENTTFSTTYLIEKDFEHNIPIGKPISNSTAYIFDKNLNYQPIGVIGELYVGGDGLSKGYLSRDDLNKTSFIEHPSIPGERLYKTGDRAKWLPDGNIEFHGRIDNQLKIRGFRIELEEIESVISEIEGVIETIIKPLKIGEGDIRLAAFLHVREKFNMDTKEISRLIRKKLPPYMIPSAFKLMNEFPKNVNDKIDKDALTIEMDDLVSRENYDIRNITPTEKKILDIWCDALKTKDILITDNFFSIGGNSILAISVFSKIESVFGIDLSLRIFFDSPRIKDLAEIIDIDKQKSGKQKPVDMKDKTKSDIIEGEI